MGGVKPDDEIPLPLMLFYLFHEAAPGGPHGLSGSSLKHFNASCVGDNVRWGVWLGRHIC